MSSVGYHEPAAELSDETKDRHRAIVSLREEMEAVDRDNQRADVCKDAELKAIRAHNRDEGKEDAAEGNPSAQGRVLGVAGSGGILSPREMTSGGAGGLRTGAGPPAVQNFRFG